MHTHTHLILKSQVDLDKKITENEGLQQSLCEGQSRWRQSIDQVRGMLLDEGAVPPVRSGEEASLLVVIDEYRKRMEGKLCAMEEKYQSAIKAAEEGSKKKQEAEEQPHLGEEVTHGGTNPTLHVQIDECSAVVTEGANNINVIWVWLFTMLVFYGNTCTCTINSYTNVCVRV